MNRPLRNSGPAVIALLLAACVTVPDDHHGVALQDVALAAHAGDIALGRDAWPQAHWWTDYGDTQLDVLVTQALGTSPTLAVARSRIDAANAAVALSGSQSGFGATADAGVNRQRYSGNGLFPEPIGGNEFNDFAVQLKVGYDFDWWGKHRALVASALGEANARSAERAQAERVLAAAVTASYFKLQSLWARQSNAQALVLGQRAVLADKARRVEGGIARADEQQGAQLTLARHMQETAQLGADAMREREALRALVAGDANSLTGLAPRPIVAARQAMPAKLGIELLARRPDLLAARYRVEAVLGRVAASQAAFYPDINLVGSFGLDALDLGKLLRTASRTMFVGSTIELPIFDSARLNAALESDRARRDEMIADYNRLVFDAVRDVAQEGATLQGLDAQLAQQGSAADASAALLHGARLRLARGLADQAAVLQAQQAALAQEGTRLQLLQQQRQSEVALIKALGGGFRAEALRFAGGNASTNSHTPTP